MGLPSEHISIPFSKGLDTKPDSRSLASPGLARCQNAVFDETGGIQKRAPFSKDLSSSGLAGQTVRRLAVYEDQLLAFTNDALFVYDEGTGGGSGWNKAADYLAAKVIEESVFVRPNEQVMADRASTSEGYTVWVWEERGSSTESWYACIDEATGTVMVPPTSMGVRTHPRVLNGGDATVYIFTRTSGKTEDLEHTRVSSPEVASPGSFSWTTAIAGIQPNGAYDAQVFRSTATVGASDVDCVAVAEWDGDGNYKAVVVKGASVTDDRTVGRDSDGPLAVAVNAAEDTLAVVRISAPALATVYVDFLNADLSDDASVDINLGTTLSGNTSNITGAWVDASNVTVFWSSGEDNTSLPSQVYVEKNTVTTGGSAGTKATVIGQAGLASHAFLYNGTAFVWAVFAGGPFSTSAVTVSNTSLQNTYLLVSADGAIHAKASPTSAGGFRLGTHSQGLLNGQGGWLPAVRGESATRFVVGAIERRKVPTGEGTTSFQARAPRRLEVEFDSDEARRVTHLGQTLYISGGQVLQWDGVNLAELGFHIYPYVIDTDDLATGGNLEEGAYAIKTTLRWSNAKGETERSTTASIANRSGAFAVDANKGPLRYRTNNAYTTLKKGTTTGEISLEFWRTKVDPVFDSPYFLATGVDPGVQTGDNPYVENDPTATNPTIAWVTDDLSDADLGAREANPENGQVLENVAPPAATIITSDADRIYLAGVSYDPNLIWYSKLRAEGELAAFNEALTVQIPGDAGAITALAHLNETLIVFCEHGVWGLPGVGFDNFGQGANFGPPKLISSDVGCVSSEAVVTSPEGLLFKSSKGWFALDRGWGVRYIGGPVADFDGDTIVRCHSMPNDHHVRLWSTDRVLIYDLVVGEWSEWTITNALDAAIRSSGAEFYLQDSSFDVVEQEDWATAGDVGDEGLGNYSLLIETAWVKLSQLVGFYRARSLYLLGEYVAPHDLKVELARDFDDATFFQAKTWTVAPASAGPELVEHRPTIQKVAALKVRLTDRSVGADSAPAGAGCKLTGMTLEFARKAAGWKGLPPAQKQ